MPYSHDEKTPRKLTPGRLAAAAIAVFWAAMMTALVRREVLPAWRQMGPVTYASLLRPTELARRSRMGIYFRGRRIGQAETYIQRTRDGGIDITSRMDISLAMLPLPLPAGPKPVTMILAARVGKDNALRGFDLHVGAPIHLELKGRVEDDRLILTSQLAGGPPAAHRLRFDPRTIMTSAASPFLGVRRLHVGKSWTIAALDPFSQQVRPVRLTVTARERMTVDGRPADVFVVETRRGAWRFKSWITADGEVVRQDTPYGFSLRREKAP